MMRCTADAFNECITNGKVLVLRETHMRNNNESEGKHKNSFLHRMK